MSRWKKANNDNDYYVYAHLDPNTKEIFYIGKGSGYRVIERVGSSTPWIKRVLGQKGFLFKIIKFGLTEQKALDLEESIINEMLDKDKNSLVNNRPNCMVKALKGGQIHKWERNAKILIDWKNDKTNHLTDDEYKQYIKKIEYACNIYNIETPMDYKPNLLLEKLKENE